MSEIDSHRNAILDYFDCFKTPDRDRLRSLLSDNFNYISPYGSWTDADQMISDIWDNVTGDRHAVDFHVYGTPPEYIVTYRHNVDESSAFAERFRFDDGLITEIAVYPIVGLHDD